MRLAFQRVVLLGLIPLLPVVVVAQALVINEFMALNDGAFLDEAGEDNDWIELYNPTSETISLAGLYLSDRLNNPTKWMFPMDAPALTTLDPGEYVVIWASGQTSTDSELHASFKLSGDGEAIVLTASDGWTLLDQIVFDQQTDDVSFGRYPDANDNWGYMLEPTPGQANSEVVLGWLEPVQFSVKRGFYDDSFTVSLATDDPDAEIWYTTDANEPHGTYLERYQYLQYYGQVYTEPITIAQTTCLRAVAVKTGWYDSEIVTQSYLFTSDIIEQSDHPIGFPSSWKSRIVDYAMDQDVVDSYRDEIEEDLKSTPIVCISLPNDSLFGDDGIYTHPTRRGRDWERQASMEWIDPNTGEDFCVNAGLRIQGGDYARASSSTPKSGLQFFFRGDYGPTKLEYPLFPDTEVRTFDRLALRAIWNYSWVGDSGSYGADYLRDVFFRDCVRDMNGLTPHGRGVQVYLNGLYWGMYILTERVDETFASEHLGGDDEDYDILEAPNGQGSSTTMKVADGNEVTAQEDWATLFSLAHRNLSDANNYEALCDFLDVPALIDYMLMIYYTGSRDAPVYLGDSETPRNFYSIRSRGTDGPFYFIPWDVEWCLESPTINRVGVVGVWNPHVLINELLDNDEFKLLLADHIHRHFHNDGALTRDMTTSRYMIRADEICGAIVGESARWGDVLRSQAYTREDWQDEVDRLVSDFFSSRTETVMEQFKDAGWYPSVEAPEFYINDVAGYAEVIQDGDVLTMTCPDSSGVIYYTLDGTDPYQAQAQVEEGDIVTLIAEDAAKRIWVPLQDIGATWQGADESFDDSVWTDGQPALNAGTGAVGYELGVDYVSMITYDVLNQMFGVNASCYIRIPFTLSQDELDRISTLLLRVRCDDGFVAYLNGQEVASMNRPEDLTWNSDCETRSDNTDWVMYSIDDRVDQLQAGENILAIQALNQDSISSDFLFSVDLTASEQILSNLSPSARAYSGPLTLQSDTIVKARALGNEWSALTEGTYWLEE